MLKCKPIPKIWHHFQKETHQLMGEILNQLEAKVLETEKMIAAIMMNHILINKCRKEITSWIIITINKTQTDTETVHLSHKSNEFNLLIYI